MNRSFDLGTQFSERAVSDNVVDTEFKWGMKLLTIEIYYASRERLVAMGVPVDQAREVAFPNAFKPQGFCKPPRK